MLSQLDSVIFLKNKTTLLTSIIILLLKCGVSKFRFKEKIKDSLESDIQFHRKRAIYGFNRFISISSTSL